MNSALLEKPSNSEQDVLGNHSLVQKSSNSGQSSRVRRTHNYRPNLASYIFWQQASDLRYSEEDHSIYLQGHETLPPFLRDSLDEGFYLFFSLRGTSVMAKTARTAHDQGFNTIRLEGRGNILLSGKGMEAVHPWYEPIDTGVFYVGAVATSQAVTEALRMNWRVVDPGLEIQERPNRANEVATIMRKEYGCDVKMVAWRMEHPNIGEFAIARFYDREALELAINDPVAAGTNPPAIKLPEADWSGWQY